MFNKRKKHIFTVNDIKNELLIYINETKKFYKVQHTYQIDYGKKDKFISDILNDLLNEILFYINNDIYTFKYQIYNQPLIQPTFEFMTKEQLKKQFIFTEKINENKYKKTPFGIRLDFIDTEAYRISYIITIE